MRLGVTETDLVPKSKDEFELMFPDPQDQQQCIDHFESRRQELLADVIQTRADIVDKEGDQPDKA